MTISKTPWEVVIDEDGRECIKSGGYWIAECIGSPGADKETSASNAEFIVRACNNHDALVDLLRDISGTMQQHDPMKERILTALAATTA